MRWRKSDLWKAGIALAGMPLFLVLMVWVPVSAASAQERASGPATPAIIGNVQATPTEDATVTALNKEKLAQEVQQLKNQNEPDFFVWFRTNSAILLSTLVVVIGGLIGLFRWLGDRRDAQNKYLNAQTEERFKTAVTALGDEKEGTQVGGAILLRSFLNPDDKKSYERYYTQIFDLAVAYLRLPRASHPSENPDGIPPSPENPNPPLPLTALSLALIVVFKEAFPLVRDARTRNLSPFNPRSLDASCIQLDSAYLAHADLNNAWIRDASLRKTNLADVNLCKADLRKANLTGADLTRAHLEGANFRKACLEGADFSATDLRGAVRREVASVIVPEGKKPLMEPAVPPAVSLDGEAER